MDVIEASNLEVIKSYLELHPNYEFTARKYSDHWLLTISEYDGSLQFQMTGNTFGETAKKLALSLYIFNQAVIELTNKVTGVNGNERSNEN